MNITKRQRWLLRHVDEIVYRQKTTGTFGFFLNKEDCSATIQSLIAKGLLIADGDRTKLHRAAIAHRYL